jgi:hypothetical protein
MGAKWGQNGDKMETKWGQNGGKKKIFALYLPP